METFDSVASRLSWLNSSVPSESLKGIYEVWHYTGGDHLKDILHKKSFTNDDTSSDLTVVSLKLSDIRCLNDYSENQNAIGVFRDVCRQAKKDGLIKDGFFNQIFGLEPPKTLFLYIDDERSKTQGMPHYGIQFSPYYRFVACFSDTKDLLSMWRYYLRNRHYDGYCIGLNRDEIESKMEHYGGTQYHVTMVRMIYSDAKKREKIWEVLSQLNAVWDESTPVTRVEQAVQEHLWTWSLMFKHHGFFEEKEVRIVVDIPINKIAKAKQVPDVMDEVAIEDSMKDGITTPHILLHFRAQALDSVMIAPFTNDPDERTVQEEVVFRYLHGTGFVIDREDVKCSDIPVRF